MSLGSEVRTQLERHRHPPQNSPASFTLDWWPGLPWQLLGAAVHYRIQHNAGKVGYQPMVNWHVGISTTNNISRSLLWSLWEPWSNGWTWMNNSDDRGTMMNVSVTQYGGLFLLKWLVKCKIINTHHTTPHFIFTTLHRHCYFLLREWLLYLTNYKSQQLDTI